MTGVTAASQLFVAGLVGLAVGFERERSGHATGPTARFAGLRTFFLIGVLGGTAGLLMTSAPGPAAALIATGGAFVVASYVVAVHTLSRDDRTIAGKHSSGWCLAPGLVRGSGFPARDIHDVPDRRPH